jgi:hypothetical protein
MIGCDGSVKKLAARRRRVSSSLKMRLSRRASVGLAMNGRLMPLDPNRRCRIQYFWPWLGMAALIGLIWAELGRATERPFVLGQTSDETSVNLYLVEWE